MSTRAKCRWHRASEWRSDRVDRVRECGAGGGPRAPASGSRAASPTALTRSCSANSPAPTITASASWSPTATTPRRCAHSASRAREDLVQARVELANQLRAEHERFWPGAVAIFAEIDSPIGLAFLQRYPSPGDARGLGDKRLAACLARHAYSGRKNPAQLLGKLRDAPQGRAGDAETEARRAIVLALVAALKPIVRNISQLTYEIAHRVRAHPEGHVFLSLFKDPKSVVCAAALLSEIGDCRARYGSAEALAADAVSPSPSSRANARSRAFAAAATTACAQCCRAAATARRPTIAEEEPAMAKASGVSCKLRP